VAHKDADAPRSTAPPGPDAILEAIDREREAASAPAAEPERVPYLGFFLGAEVYGLPLRQLREVARLTRVRRIPGAPPSVAGLVNLRGEIVCALDARAILGLGAPAPGVDPAFFVALRGFPDPLGLVVDGVADIYAIDPNEIEPPPATWPAERAAYFTGTARVPEGLMGLLDLDRVVGI
jgi:purine-binding chemotaxis protein CheW